MDFRRMQLAIVNRFKMKKENKIQLKRKKKLLNKFYYDYRQLVAAIRTNAYTKLTNG